MEKNVDVTNQTYENNTVVQEETKEEVFDFLTEWNKIWEE